MNLHAQSNNVSSPFSLIKNKEVLNNQSSEINEVFENLIEAQFKNDKLENWDDKIPTLLNKVGFQKEVEKKLNNYTGSFVIIYFDGDHFKSINDIYNHSTGDEAIVAMGKAIENASRLGHPLNNARPETKNEHDNDLLSRQSGDEFCVLLMPRGQGTWSAEEAIRAAIVYQTRIAAILDRGIPVTKDGVAQTLKLSMTGGEFIGSTDDNLSFLEMKDIADKKMHENKEKRGTGRQ